MSELSLEELIKQRLSPLHPSKLILEDESEAHAGHAGALEFGGGHYHLRIISEAFHQMNRLQRHRLVYNHVNDLIPHRIHAIAIETFTSEEWVEHNQKRI